MVHGGMTIVKYLLFIFNFIFWLSGLGLISLGTYIQIHNAVWINFFGNSYLQIPIILICLGVIIAIIGFFGCCGAVRESYCMTMTFAVFLGIIFILEFAAGIASYVMRREMEAELKRHTITGIALYNTSNSKPVTDAWDKLQQRLECCGVDGANGFTNWNESNDFRDKNTVPISCCREDDCDNHQRDKSEAEASSVIYTKGCFDSMIDHFGKNVAIVGGVACGVALIQLLGISFACCLSKSILKEYEDYFY